MQFKIFGNEGSRNVVVVDGNVTHGADESHPNFQQIVDGLLENDASVIDLFDVGVTAQREFERLTDRVSVLNGNVYFDGDVVDNSLTQAVATTLEHGGDFEPLVNFFDRVMDARNDHTRTRLFDWLRLGSFAVGPDGNIYGFKGVRDNYGSITPGPGVVNGVESNGHLDNTPGNVVEIARSKVVADPAIGCASGLHVGTYGYASSFAGYSGGRVVLVSVDPRDVVSVPTDCEDQKMRVVRYTVIADVQSEDEAWDIALDDGAVTLD